MFSFKCIMVMMTATPFLSSCIHIDSPPVCPANSVHVPQGRAGNEASQTMLISGNKNLSQLKNCLEIAHKFLLSEEYARRIFAKQKEVIENNWATVCDEAELSAVDRALLWNRQFLNPFSIEE